MIRTDLIAYCRLRIPEINSTDVISDANLIILLNRACAEFINKTDALPTSITFTLAEGTTTYSLATYVPTFGKIRKEGVWVRNSQNSNRWDALDPYTTEKLSRDFPNWLNISSSLPLRYVIEGDELIINPAASSTYAGSGNLKIFYFKRSVDMDNAVWHPFGGSSTIYPHLADYEEVVFDYVRSIVKNLIGKNADAQEAKQTFYAKCAYVKQVLSYRPDLIKNTQANGAGNLAHFKGAFQ